jgi:hypothetical protein
MDPRRAALSTVTAVIAQLTVEPDVKVALVRALEEHLSLLVNSVILAGCIHPGVTGTGEACGGLGNTTETLFGDISIYFLILVKRINVSLCGRVL